MRFFLGLFTFLFYYDFLLAQHSGDFQLTDRQLQVAWQENRFEDMLKIIREAKKDNTVYPRLFIAEGFALLKLDKPMLAADSYLKALKLNSFNDQAKQGWQEANQLSNFSLRAGMYKWSASTEDYVGTKKKAAFKLVSHAGISIGIKMPQQMLRQNASFSSLNLGTQISDRVFFTQQVGLFNQNITAQFNGNRRDKQGNLIVINYNERINQKQYHGSLHAQLLPRLEAQLALQSAKATLSTGQLSAMIWISGAKIQLSNFQIYSNLGLGRLNGSQYNQEQICLSWYPKANPNSYLSGGFSSVSSNTGRTGCFHFAAGKSLAKRSGLEFFGILGDYTNSIQSEGSILYNTYDQALFKSGVTWVFRPSEKLTLMLGAQLDKFNIVFSSQKYFQTSLIPTLLWKP